MPHSKIKQSKCPTNNLGSVIRLKVKSFYTERRNRPGNNIPLSTTIWPSITKEGT